MLHIDKPQDSKADDDLTFYAARWLNNVRHESVFTQEMVVPFTLYMIARELIQEVPDPIDVLLYYMEKNLVGLRVSDTLGPSPFLRN